MTRITKRSLTKKHHNYYYYSREKKCFFLLGICAIFFGVTNIWLGSEYAPNSSSSGERKLLHQLLLRRKGNSKLKSFQNRQVQDCQQFPIQISKKKDDLEKIEHPVSSYQHWTEHIQESSIPKQEPKKKFIQVPKLYATNEMREYLGNYGQRLMTKQEALSIGSHVYLKKNKKQQQGDIPKLDPTACGTADVDVDSSSSTSWIKLETINVMIASFRDGMMCKNTLHGLFTRAKYPQRIRVTLIDQVLLEPPTKNDAGADASDYYDKMDDFPCMIPTIPCEQDPLQVLCLYRNQIDTISPFNALDSSGPVTSRHLVYRMYRGEYFILQCDSHVEFTYHWDVDIIEQWYMTKNEMAIFSVYPDQAYLVNTTSGERMTKARAIMCSTCFENDEDVGYHLRHDQEPKSLPDFQDDLQAQLQPLWAAGFSFGRGHFVINVPYDLYLPNVFQGEESNIGIRAFTYGYDMYAPSRPIVYHYYKNNKNKKDNKDDNIQMTKKKRRLKFWDLPTYDDEVALEAMQRLNAIIELRINDNDGHVFPKSLKEYGIGQVRTTDKYYKTFGFHRENKTMEPNLCMFVASKEMNLLFLPALRDDTMGLDYNHENLKDWEFKDIWPCPDYWWLDDSCPTSSKDNNKGESTDDEKEEEEEGSSKE